jgi:hypothetical protein
MKPTKAETEGHWVVKKKDNFVYWCAWREWLIDQAARKFIPNTMTVWGEWPPRTPEAASIVAKLVNGARGREKIAPMNETPEPWTMYPISVIEEMERKHRNDINFEPEQDSPAKRKQAEI